MSNTYSIRSHKAVSDLNMLGVEIMVVLDVDARDTVNLFFRLSNSGIVTPHRSCTMGTLKRLEINSKLFCRLLKIRLEREGY